MRIPKRFKRIADKRPCHTVAVIYDGDVQIIIYKQWISFHRYWVYHAIEGVSLYEELYYKKYSEFPKNRDVFAKCIRTKSKPIPKKPIKTNPFFGGEKK